MPNGRLPSAVDTARFGRFGLQPSLRRLEKDGLPVSLGGRALDILIVLVDRAGEIVSHQELQEKVWQNVVVEASSLRVQINALRKVLGENEDGDPYIINVSGRGYCFVAPVIRTLAEPVERTADDETALPAGKKLVGRDEAVRNVIARLVETRFVTIVGTGGVGKTAVAIAAAHALEPAFRGAVHFIDLGAVASAHAAHVLLGRTILRRFVVSDGAVQGLAKSVQGRRMLIVLDCCDGLSAAMGDLAAALVRESADVHVLATSRERLGGGREAVFALPPLAYPPDPGPLPADALTEYSAVKLLTDLVGRAGHASRLDDAEIRALARMTEQLDGLPLALELAAASIAQTGIANVASMVDSRFALFMTNPHATDPRHESLNAALEWSYGRLTAEQRIIFRNLAVFAGPFTIDAVHKVAAEADMDAPAATAAAMALLAKSMIVQDAGTDALRYRLLDTSRTFGLSKLLTFGNAETVKQRHAAYITQYLTLADASTQCLRTARLSNGLTRYVPDIRAALEWCFSAHGDARLGARLAAVASHVFSALWLNAEIRSWLLLALASLDEDCIGTQLELDIRAGILMNTIEPDDLQLIPTQLPPIIHLADKLGSHIYRAEARAWEVMMMATLRPIEQTVDNARTLREIAIASGDYPTRLLGDWLLGLACHLKGALDEVGPLCASAATLSFPGESVYFSGAQHSARIGAIGCLARTLWLRGQPDAALRVARAVLPDLRGKLFNLRLVRRFFVPMFIWAGALEDAEDLLATVHQDSGHEVDICFANMYLGALNLRRGNLDQSATLLRDAYGAKIAVADQGVVATDLAEALSLLGHYEPARRAIDLAFAAGDAFGECFHTPERFRVMGSVMSIAPASKAPLAETWFLRAIDCARRQGSLSFALRAATNLCQFYQARGMVVQARATLADIYGQFHEGFGTADLRAARDLLDGLQCGQRAPAELRVPG